MKGPDLHATERAGCCVAVIINTTHLLVAKKKLPHVNHVKMQPSRDSVATAVLAASLP
jgi:hypothetical protein